MQAFDLSSVAVAIPDIAREFGGDPLSYDSVIIAYIAGATAALPLCGWAVDRLGARRLFLAALVLFGAAALACGLAVNTGMLLAARVFQGAAGAMMLPVGRVIVLGATDETKFVEAMAALTMPLLLGPVIGPPVAGLLVTAGSWRWLFLVMVPLAMLGFAMVLRQIAAVPAAHRDPFDFTGSLLLMAGLAAVAVGVGALGGMQADWLFATIVTGSGLLLFAIYRMHERRSRNPVLSLAPFRHVLVRTANIGGMWVRTLTGATPFLLALLFQLRFGMTAAEAGGLILALALGSLTGRAMTTWALRKAGFRAFLTANSVGVALSVAACGFFAKETASYVIFAVLFVQGILRSMQLISLSVLSFSGLPKAEFSAASTISSISQQLAQSFGIAIATLSVNLLGRFTADQGAAVSAAFFVLAGVSLASMPWFMRLADDAGATMSGRSGA